jgi:hypothetical protein
MIIRKPLTARIICCLLALVALVPPAAYAQEAITTESLDDWFYSRLLWSAVVGAIIGVLLGLFYLCRLPFEQRQGLNVNRQAKRKFWAVLATLSVVCAVLLFMDVWQLHEFGPLSLQFGEAFSQVWWNYRTLFVLAATALAFWLAVALTTRLKPGCHCRYAFLRGPRV